MKSGQGALEETAQEEQLANHAEQFAERFGAGGEVRLFFSPGRVNLMGAHLDYNGGPVMPTAIDRGTFVAIRARDDDRLSLASTVEDAGLEASMAHLPKARTGSWVDYPLGVVHHLMRPDSKRRGSKHSGADVLFGGNLPIGAGLSSSASMCVGVASAFDALWDLGSSAKEIIEAALWAEREFVGVQCGIMDPYAVTLTRPDSLLWLNCRDRAYEHVPLDADRVTIAVADTGVRRELAAGAFNQRVAECARAFEVLRRYAPDATCLCDVSPDVLAAHGLELEPEVRRRAEHVLSEFARTKAARAALFAGDLEGFGRQMSAAHESLRDLFEVSIPELDALVEAALSWHGVLGTRLTGAGFGGCIVVLMRTSARPGFREHLRARYASRFGTRPEVEFFRGGTGPREIRLGRT